VLRELTDEGPDVFIKRLDAGPRSRLTDDEADERWPLWRPGTDSVAFVSTRGGGMDVWMKRADGLGEARLLIDAEPPIATLAWSPDGEWLILRTSGPRGAEGARDIYGFRPGVDTVPVPLMADPGYDEMYPDVSPDGRLIAYQSTETDRHEIYVRPFPDVTSGKWQVSVNGGRQPRWSPLGDELFFQGPNREMMVAEVEVEPAFRASTPVTLFDGEDSWYFGDILGNFFFVAPDAQRFMMARQVAEATTPAGEEEPVRAVLVNNFIEELKARVPIH
jgi:Tol biopolymer transport system component